MNFDFFTRRGFCFVALWCLEYTDFIVVTGIHRFSTMLHVFLHYFQICKELGGSSKYALENPKLPYVREQNQTRMQNL